MRRTLLFGAFGSVILIMVCGCGGDSGRGALKGKVMAKSSPQDAAVIDGAATDMAVGKERDKSADKGKDGNSKKGEARAQAGLLTAGSFDDNQFPDPFRRFLQRFRQGQQTGIWPEKLAGKQLGVTVKGKGGAPMGNAALELSDGKNRVQLLSRTDGRAIFLSSWDGFDIDKKLTLTVTPPDGSPAGTYSIPAGSSQFDVSMPRASASLPTALDLVLVLDTTGSMQDELKYLGTEIESIAARVRQKFPQVAQRFALILYRDEGDDYVTRTFPFTKSVEEFQRQLAAQKADGGGDYPEAVHKGLAEALKLQWQKADTARMLFLIGDAPPHARHMDATWKSVDGLRKRGVVFYPLACSGYDEAVELVWRGSALATGGQFLFLTDDSGVGDPHAEPHIPFYNVERLDRLMIRLIASELAGKRVEADPKDIVRSSGKPPAAAQKE